MSIINHELKKSIDAMIRDVYERGLWEMKQLGKQPPAHGGLAGNTHRQGELAEAANRRMLECLLSFQPHFGCEDKAGVLAASTIDLFMDYAQLCAYLQDKILAQGSHVE